MFISPYVNLELGHWYIIRKVKGYPCCKTITPVSSESSNINEVIKSILNFLFVFFTVRFHKYKKA